MPFLHQYSSCDWLERRRPGRGRFLYMLLSDQIRYFAAAARHEHLGRAADELDMSQPALSRSILKLEQAIVVQLFDREGRGVRLNNAGKILLQRIERAYAECEDAVRELREQRNSSRKTISIGYFATF